MWHVSVSLRNPTTRKPVPLVRWTGTHWARAEAIRDKVMEGLGTSEPFILEQFEKQYNGISPHWRRPLSISEIGRMAMTDAVRRRPGRP